MHSQQADERQQQNQQLQQQQPAAHVQADGPSPQSDQQHHQSGSPGMSQHAGPDGNSGSMVKAAPGGLSDTVGQVQQLLAAAQGNPGLASMIQSAARQHGLSFDSIVGMAQQLPQQGSQGTQWPMSTPDQVPFNEGNLSAMACPALLIKDAQQRVNEI